MFTIINVVYVLKTSGRGKTISAILSCKVDVPDSVTFLIRTPIFEWYVDWYGSKNKYQKGTCSKEIGLYSYMITILGSIVHIIGRTYLAIL